MPVTLHLQANRLRAIAAAISLAAAAAPGCGLPTPTPPTESAGEPPVCSGTEPHVFYACVSPAENVNVITTAYSGTVSDTAVGPIPAGCARGSSINYCDLGVREDAPEEEFQTVVVDDGAQQGTVSLYLDGHVLPVQVGDPLSFRGWTAGFPSAAAQLEVWREAELLGFFGFGDMPLGNMMIGDFEIGWGAPECGDPLEGASPPGNGDIRFSLRVSRGGESVEVPPGAVVGFQGYDVVHNSTWNSDCSTALYCGSGGSSFALVRE